MNVQNPISELEAAARDAFPAIDCDVTFAVFPDDGPYGQTLWPDDGGRVVVQVAVGIPLEAVVEVMAHELAHVVAGADAEHGQEWEAAFDAIHRAYCRRMLPWEGEAVGGVSDALQGAPTASTARN